MRALPEDPPAYVAGDELRLPLEYAGRYPLADFLFGDVSQGRVASQAKPKCAGAAGKIQASVKLAQLRVGLERSNVAAMGNGPALQEFAIAREHDAGVG